MQVHISLRKLIVPWSFLMMKNTQTLNQKYVWFAQRITHGPNTIGERKLTNDAL